MDLIICFSSDTSSRKVKPRKLRKVLGRLSKLLRFRIYDDDNIFVLEFFPSAYLYLELNQGDLSGKSMIIHQGPGFHKYICDFINILARKLRIKIIVEDETNYYHNQNFKKLEEKYFSILKEILEEANSCIEGSIIFWPYLEWRPQNIFGFTLFPTGRLNLDDLADHLLRGDLRELASIIFIWPNQERDEFYFRNLGLYLLWTEFSWVEPRSEAEENLVFMIFDNFQKSKIFNPKINLPKAEIREIEAIFKGDKAKENGIGHRKGNIVYYLFSGWRCILPGSYMIERSDDGIRFRNTDKIIYLNSKMEAEESKQFTNDDLIEFELNGSIYKACHYLAEGETKYHFLDGMIINENEVLNLHITWIKEEDFRWAFDVFRNIEKA